MARNIIGQTSAPLYTVGDQEDKTVQVRWKDGPRYCKICGKELVGRQQSYCSPECKEEGKRKNGRDYYDKVHQYREKAKQDRATKRTSCLCCGQPIPKGRIVFCSDKCANDWQSSVAKEQEREKKAETAEKEAKKKKAKTMTMEQVLKGMEKTGMQYGEYVAKMEREGKL